MLNQINPRDRRYVVETFPRPYLVMLLVWLGWFPIVFARLGIVPLIPKFEASLHLSHATSGLLMSAYMFPYALMQVPAGRVSERFGSKKIMLVGMLGASLFTLVLWRADTFEISLLARGFAGLFSGLFFVPAAALLNSNVPKEKAGSIFGVTWTAPSIAQVALYGFISAGVLTFSDWRILFMLMALPGIMIAMFTHLSYKPTVKIEYATDEEPKISFLSQLKSRLMLSLLLFNFSAGTVSWALQTFIPTYLVAARGLSVSTAALYALMYPVGSIPSSIISGVLKDKIDFRIPVLGAVLLWITGLILFPLTPSGVPLIFVIFLLGFGPQLYWNPIMVTIITKFHPSIRGRLLGAFNMMSFFAASIGPFVFGVAADISFGTYFSSMQLILLVPLAVAFSLFWRMRMSK